MHIIGSEEAEAVRKVIEAKQLFRFPGNRKSICRQFEEQLAEKYGVQHALAVNSGTNALVCAMVALGIGPGDEVIVPAYTYMATAMAPLMVGAVPILAEIDNSLMIDPNDVEKKITPYTKAIIPVHMSNSPCNIRAILKIARKHNLFVCEDAAQSSGVTVRGQYTGTFGDMGMLSFNFFKNISCGEGGAILTNDEALYERALMYHDSGTFVREESSHLTQTIIPGMNCRISEIQGAIMQVQLSRLDNIMKKLRARRQAMAGILAESKHFRVVRTHDAAGAAGLAVRFRSEEKALEFSARHRLRPLILSGKHVYRNWTPLMTKSAIHPKFNPYKMARRKIDYHPEMCPNTLDILSRTCLVNPNINETLAETRKRAQALSKDQPA